MNFEQPSQESSGAEKEAPTIANSNNFEELFEALRELGGLQGSHKFYSADNLIERINKVRKGEDAPISITDSEGLRMKVIELGGKEVSEVN
jgi:hypothetical protein